MAWRDIQLLAPDQLWERWQADVARIEEDAKELFLIRRQFREIAMLFEENHALQSVGGNLWLWLRTLYASTVLMRFRREVDGQGNTINLRTLLSEIEQRPDVITRSRIITRVPAHTNFIVPLLSESFSKDWMTSQPIEESPEDCIDATFVARDRAAFEDAAQKFDEVASRTIAHRPRIEPKETSVEGVNAAFDLFEELLKKYIALLTGASLMNVEPVAQLRHARAVHVPMGDRGVQGVGGFQEKYQNQRP